MSQELLKHVKKQSQIQKKKLPEGTLHNFIVSHAEKTNQDQVKVAMLGAVFLAETYRNGINEGAMLYENFVKAMQEEEPELYAALQDVKTRYSKDTSDEGD